MFGMKDKTLYSSVSESTQVLKASWNVGSILRAPELFAALKCCVVLSSKTLKFFWDSDDADYEASDVDVFAFADGGALSAFCRKRECTRERLHCWQLKIVSVGKISSSVYTDSKFGASMPRFMRRWLPVTIAWANSVRSYCSDVDSISLTSCFFASATCTICSVNSTTVPSW